MIIVNNFQQFRLVNNFMSNATSSKISNVPTSYPAGVDTKGIHYDVVSGIEFERWVVGKPFHNEISPILVSITTPDEQNELVKYANLLGLTWASGAAPTTFNLKSVAAGDRVVKMNGILAKGTFSEDRYNDKKVISVDTFKKRYHHLIEGYYADKQGLIAESNRLYTATDCRAVKVDSPYQKHEVCYKNTESSKSPWEKFTTSIPTPVRKESKLRSLLPKIVKVASDDVIYTMNGKIALKNAKGEHVRYNTDSQTIDREVMFTDFEVGKYCYEIPVTSVAAGDIIKHQGKYLQVLSKGAIGYQAIDLDTHQLITVLKTTIANLPQLSFFTKVVCLFDQTAAQNTGINPMLFLLSDDLESNNLLPLFLLMGNGENNSQINQVLPMLLMASKEDGDDNSLALLMMLQGQGQQGFDMNSMLPLLLLSKKGGKDSSMKTFAMMQMMQAQGGSNAQPFNPMMLAMLGDGDDSMKDLLMLQAMQGGNLFGQTAPTAPVAPVAPVVPVVPVAQPVPATTPIPAAAVAICDHSEGGMADTNENTIVNSPIDGAVDGSNVPTV